MNVEFLESISNLLNKNEETYWQKASASLDASAKIYGFRVDSVHSETFKFLGGLSRNEKSNENNNEAGDLDSENNDKKDKDKRPVRHNGFSTLEKDVKKLNLTKFDLEFEIDPLFKSMTGKFSESGARALLLNNFPLNENLDVLLESQAEEPNKELAQSSDKANDLSESNKKLVDEFVSSMTIDELTSLQIAPDLGYFKQTRNLENNIEKSFYHNFINELDSGNEAIDEMDENLEIGDNMDNMLPDNLSITSQNKDIQPINENEINDIGVSMSNMGAFNNTTSFGGEGFSLFKHEDILEYENKFGNGSRSITSNPQFQNFMKAFNKLDNSMYLRFGKVPMEASKETKRVKKEEKLFDFSESNEVSRNEIFGKESKVKKVIDNTGFGSKKDPKRKVKQFYNYDRLDVFRAFNNPEKNLFSGKEDDINPNNSMGGDNILPADDGDINQGMDMPDQSSINNISDLPNPNSTFVKFDQEYEKKFGQLYKRFDVRFIKQNIWNTFESIEEKKPQNVDFKTVVKDMSEKMDKNVLDNISTSTCFVCLLHLCNEKSNFIYIIKYRS